MRVGHAVVTGVSRGLGRAIAAEIVAGGGRVVGLSRTPQPPGDHRLTTVVGDVADAAAVDAVRDAIADAPLDLLVNNAAVGGRERELSVDAVVEMRRALEVNVLGSASLTSALLPALRAAQRPLILNIGSRMGDVGFNRSLPPDVRPASYAYRVSKAAVEMLTVALARELGDVATVLCLDPGPMATAMGRPDATRSPVTVAQEIIAQLDDLRRVPSGSSITLTAWSGRAQPIVDDD